MFLYKNRSIPYLCYFTISGENGTVETKMRATLSYDQAAIADDTASKFLQILQEILEDPQQMLLGSYNKGFDHPMAALL